MFDIIIIGAGVTGCAIARELSRYQVNVCVLEKEEDVCCGTSKANSAIVHAGFDAAEGSLMSKMNVRGNALMTQLAIDLDIPFRRNGALVVCTEEADLPMLDTLLQRGRNNGVKHLRIINHEECMVLEPNLLDKVIAALYAPTSGIICPFTLTIALAENSYENGVGFKFNTQVESIWKENDSYKLQTNHGSYEAKFVINAAGVYADDMHNMVSRNKIAILPRRGDYCLLDKSVGSYVDKTIFPVPSKLGKGVLVSPTIHGNLIVGPTAIDLTDKEATATTREGLSDLVTKAGITMKDLPIRQVITSFAGLRAHETGHEFIIQEVSDAPGFIDVAGIESPGLTSAPAIGEYVANVMKEKLGLKHKEKFIATRQGVRNPAKLSIEERNQWIQDNPAYGTVICRCESITEGEILDAIHRPLGAKSLDGIKRRTRAGMGRCQGGFCSPKVMAILARELETDLSDVTKCGGQSKIVVRHTKEVQM